MSWNTVSRIMSSAYLGLGKPEPELLQKSELSEIVFQRLAFYYEGLRTSDQNLMSKWSSEFTLASTENTKNLTTLTSSDIVLPLWAERQVTTGDNESWEFVPAVNLDTLQDKRNTGEPAVAFYDESGVLYAAFSFYGNEVSTPESTIRIRYSPLNTFSETATLRVPDNLTPMIVTDVKLTAIPLMMVNAAKFPNKDMTARIQAYAGMQQQLMMEKEEWKPLYERFVRRSRTTQRARNRSDILQPNRSRYYR